MNKHFKALFIILLLLLSSMVITANAKEQYNISYDFGIADIRSEFIINENPDTYIKGQPLELTAASCSGFDFKGWYTDDSRNNEILSLDESFSGDITLYAKWYESEYTIDYVLTTPGILTDESLVSNNNATKRKTSESVHLYSPLCSVADYTFEGWYTDTSYTTQITDIQAYTCENLTLYAKWSFSSFDIHYDMGEAEKSSYGINNPNPDNYTFGEGLLLESPSTDDPDYTFDGWYADSSFTQKITSVPESSSGSIIIYAKWIVKTYAVNYILEDESGISSEDITNTNPAERKGFDELLLNAPLTSDKNFAFVGWYSDKALTKKITQIKAGTNSDITVYAKWTRAVYSISYDYAMISPIYLKIDNPNPETYSYGDNISLLPIEAEGFIFNGWCSDKELKHKIEALDAEAYGDITLYADFTEKTYSVTYVLGGEGVEASQVVNRNHVKVRTTTQQVSLLEAQALNSDYEFDGWYLDAEYTEEIEYIRAYTTGNITLYAKWTKEEPEKPEITYIPVWGDATLSDGLSASDARTILRYSAKLETEFSDLQLRVSDINNDSKVNAADARIVLRLSAKLENINDLSIQYSLPGIAVEDGEIVFK